MTGRYFIGLATALALASPAAAAFKLMPAGKSVLIRKSGLSVTPSIVWNRLGPRIGRSAESWTLDGLSLNDLTFYAGIEEGRTLFREVDKKNQPLPRFNATMLPPDAIQMFESSYRVAAGTSLFTVGGVEPAELGGKPGFRFTYSFVQQGDEVRRSGEGVGAIIDGRLYLITYEAPTIHYFDRDVAAFRALAATAKVGPVPKTR